MNPKQNPDQRIAALEDELKQRDRRIAELKAELDDSRSLVTRMSEHVEDRSGLIDGWIEAFDMVLTDDGLWSYAPFVEEHQAAIIKYCDILRRWNKFVPKYNAKVAPRNVGRPLEASEAQQADVLRRRKHGESLQSMSDNTGLSFQTVRSIIGKQNGTDRTTRKYLERIVPENAVASKARKRVRDALPRRVNALLESKASLLKEAKGLK